MNSSNMHTSKLDKYTVLDTVFNMTVKINLVFWTALLIFLTCQSLKAWFELSRIKLYRNDLKGNKNYFDL